MIYRVVVEINTENGDPGKWDWPELIDESCELLSVTEMPELTTAQVNFLTELYNRNDLGITYLADALSVVRDMTAGQIMAICEDDAVHDAETVKDFVDSMANLISAYGPVKTIGAILPGDGDE